MTERTLTIISAIGSGLVGGVFFAFSTFVMKALGRLPAPAGIAAMQAINLDAPNPLFMLALFGSALTGAAVGVLAIVHWGEPSAPYALAGAVAGLVPALLTAVYHVPRNLALDALDPAEPGAADQWARFLVEWTVANHLRTVGGLAAAVLFTLALVR
jgi:uncharacterized membrane protein